ncbi:hypothetical protein SDC9_210372 [bioreactor metagenome]|uniref:Uncharacterized protein n=1 Tax=bioreactor metagenome TaxID=1076179 RepID=A0A645JHP2_9ZZZZ
MQWKRNDGSEVGPDEELGESLAEPVRQRQLVAVLQRMNQTVDRKIIAIQGADAGKGGRVLQAAAAVFSVGGCFAAARAAVHR